MMKRVRLRQARWAVVLSLVAALLAVGTTPASAVQYNASYYLVNEASKLCADVPNGEAFAGQIVRQWHCNYSTAQYWTFIHERYDQYGFAHWSIRPKHNPNLCLEVAGWGKHDGAKIILWRCHLGSNQLWRRTTLSKGWLSNVHSHRCLDVPGGTKEWGVQLQQWRCLDVPPQNWFYIS